MNPNGALSRGRIYVGKPPDDILGERSQVNERQRQEHWACSNQYLNCTEGLGVKQSMKQNRSLGPCYGWRLRLCWEFCSIHGTECRFVCLTHSEATKSQSLEQRKVYCKAMQGDGWLVPQNPKLLEEFQQSTFKTRWGKGEVSCCKPLGAGILCPCSCPRRSGQDVPLNLPQDKCYSLFCNFLSLWMDC